MVGEAMPEVVVVTAELTSCSISSSTRPPSLMRGVMFKMMPVLRILTELTIGAPGTCTATADWVTIGTSSPTCRVARLLSSTIKVGEDTILTSVMVLSALNTTCTLGVLKKLEKPGKFGVTGGALRATAPVVGLVVVLLVPPRSVKRNWKLPVCRNQRRPMFSWSLSVTSAIVASSSTWLGCTSICSRMRRMRRYSSDVAVMTRALLDSSATIATPAARSSTNAAAAPSTRPAAGGTADTGWPPVSAIGAAGQERGLARHRVRQCSGRHGCGGGARHRGDPALLLSAVDALQQLRQLKRGPVLDVVDVHLLFR